MKIFLIAGEASGDSIGAKLINALREKSLEPTEFCGIGGELMEESGMEALLPMSQLSVMGFFEVIPKLPKLYKIYKATIEEIEKRDPDVVVTIDFQEFNFFVGRALKKRGKTKAKIVHYVAPTVWAWRPGRAKKVAQYLDGLVCLFPFEPEYFEKHKLKTVFAGHPLVEEDVDSGDGKIFRAASGIPDDAKVVGVFFGSREREFKMLSDILKETLLYIREEYKDVHVVVPTLPHLEYHIYQILKGFDFPTYVVSKPELKRNAIDACDMTLAVSGTVALELAYKGMPHVIVYKMHPVNWELAKFVVKVRHAHLANIILKKTVVPEFLQYKCKPEKIAEAALKIMKDPGAASEQEEAFKKVRELLDNGSEEGSSSIAARFIIDVVQGNPIASGIPKNLPVAEVEPKPKAKSKAKGKTKPSAAPTAPTSASQSEHKAAQPGQYKVAEAVQSASSALQSFLSTVKSSLPSGRGQKGP